MPLLRFSANSTQHQLRRLSNAFATPVQTTYGHYPSGEHAFQAAKMIVALQHATSSRQAQDLREHVDRILAAKTPAKAKTLGSWHGCRKHALQLTLTQREAWREERVYFQKGICQYKLQHDPQVQRKVPLRCTCCTKNLD